MFTDFCSTGSGLWHPEAQPLSLMRTNIDRKPKRLRRVLTEPQMRKEILGVTQNDEKKAIKAFAEQNKENALKTKPKVCVLSFFGICVTSAFVTGGTARTRICLGSYNPLLSG